MQLALNWVLCKNPVNPIDKTNPFFVELLIFQREMEIRQFSCRRGIACLALSCSTFTDHVVNIICST